MFLSPQVAWPAVSPGLYVFAASWRGSSYFICIPGRHRYCVYCPGTFRWVSNPPPTPRASRESQQGYVMRRCPSSFRLPIHGVLWLPQWEVDSFWMYCTGTRVNSECERVVSPEGVGEGWSVGSVSGLVWHFLVPNIQSAFRVQPQD